jgi:hypothetical protein
MPNKKIEGPKKSMPAKKARTSSGKLKNTPSKPKTEIVSKYPKVGATYREYKAQTTRGGMLEPSGARAISAASRLTRQSKTAAVKRATKGGQRLTQQLVRKK